MRQIYSAGISLYATAVKLAASRNPKAQKMVDGHREVFAYLEKNRQPGDRYLWFHAASLGEFEQGRPLIEQIRKDHPEYKILLTFFSPSGYEVRKNYQGADLICYLPFDQPALAERFIEIIQPEKAFFIKYEFWANYIRALNNRHIPVYLVSAIFRPTQIFFRWYGAFFRNLLSCYSGIFVQDESSRELLDRIGVANVEVTGDTRFDRVRAIMQEAKELPLLEEFSGKEGLTLIAGSTWPKDEDIIIRHLNAHPDLKLVIAPHEIHEEHIREIIGKLKVPFVRYSQAEGKPLPADARCLIVDCIGLLSSVYRYGQIAYIGGGFGVGIHNILEAAVYGMPVIFGPNYGKFREARELIAARGAYSVENESQYDELMTDFNDRDFLKTTGQIAGYYVSHNAGATAKILKKIF